MALTVSAPSSKRTTFGRFHAQIGTVTFDSSYATGGETLNAHSFDMSEILFVIPVPVAAGYVVVPDSGHTVLQAFYGDNNNASDGALIEVPNATDLSTLVVDVVVIGY